MADKECSKLLDKRTQAKFQCLQNNSQMNRDNIGNVRHEASRTLTKKKINI
jgi:hypothetical protein